MALKEKLRELAEAKKLQANNKKPTPAGVKIVIETKLNSEDNRFPRTVIEIGSYDQQTEIDSGLDSTSIEAFIERENISLSNMQEAVRTEFNKSAEELEKIRKELAKQGRQEEEDQIKALQKQKEELEKEKEKDNGK